MSALIGLTGGIAAGKSTVSSVWRELGAAIIDADAVARSVVEPGTPALKAIGERFGTDVLRSDGALDRAALGAIVFADANERESLNAIVHPAVRIATEQLITSARSATPDAIVVYDVPLLVEAAVSYAFDLIVVVEATPEIRVRRLIDHRSLSEADARARVAAQASDAERRAAADIVIDSSGTLDATRARALEVWSQRILPLR